MNKARGRYLQHMVTDIYNRLKSDCQIPDWFDDTELRGLAENSLANYFEDHEEEVTTFYDRGKF